MDVKKDAAWDFFDAKPSSRRARLADQLTLWQSLCALGVVNRLPYSGPSWPLPVSDESWSYLRRAIAYAGVEQATLMEAIVDSFPFAKSTMWRLEGGMEELVRAFLREIPNVGRCELLSSSPVTDVAVSDGGVSVRWSDGARGGRPRQAAFDYAICAAPAPCVQRIRFHAPDHSSNLDRAEALASITYGSAAKTLVHVRRRLWEKPGSGRRAILGGASFTDLPVQQVWYPSDETEEIELEFFADPVDDGRQDLLPIAYHVEIPEEVQEDLDPDMHERQRMWIGSGFDPPLRQLADWDRPGVLTAAYIWGSGARRLAVLTEEERSRVILGAIEQLHPGIGAEIDEPPVHRIWDCERSPGDGAYALFAPGEARRYQTALIEPIRDRNGHARVYFAGEHLAIAHGWIQSAMQSALACVMHML